MLFYNKERTVKSFTPKVLVSSGVVWLVTLPLFPYGLLRPFTSTWSGYQLDVWRGIYGNLFYNDVPTRIKIPFTDPLSPIFYKHLLMMKTVCWYGRL